MKIGRGIANAVNSVLGRVDYELVRKLPDMYLHEYDSYEQYREVQIFYNKKKLEGVWADEATLTQVGQRVLKEFGSEKPIVGLCHGARNGFEQNFLAEKFGFDVTGTDISDTATQFPRSVQWDFHDVKPEWVNHCDFVYTNSLDQSWKPNEAVATWLDQLHADGLLFIEHNRWHGPRYAGEMDPFGVKVEYMPYLLAQWFGHRITIEIMTGQKANTDAETWVFVVKKLIDAPFRS